MMLHCYADRMAGSSQVVAEEESNRQFRLLPVVERSEVVLRTLHNTVEDAVIDWTEDLKERAGLSTLLSNKFGWDCAFDVKSETIMEKDNIPNIERRLAEIEDEVEMKNKSSVLLAELDPELMSRKATVSAALSESRATLREVKRRLLRHWQVKGDNSKRTGLAAKIEWATWTAKPDFP